VGIELLLLAGGLIPLMDGVDMTNSSPESENRSERSNPHAKMSVRRLRRIRPQLGENEADDRVRDTG